MKDQERVILNQLAKQPIRLRKYLTLKIKEEVSMSHPTPYSFGCLTPKRAIE